MATACTAGSYCEAGTERPMACPSGTQSAELANELADCVTSPGYYGPNGMPRATDSHPCPPHPPTQPPTPPLDTGLVLCRCQANRQVKPQEFWVSRCSDKNSNCGAEH